MICKTTYTTVARVSAEVLAERPKPWSVEDVSESIRLEAMSSHQPTRLAVVALAFAHLNPDKVSAEVINQGIDAAWADLDAAKYAV